MTRTCFSIYIHVHVYCKLLIAISITLCIDVIGYVSKISVSEHCACDIS